MGLLSRVARERRFVRGLFGALGAVKDISSDSTNLVCDDWERAVDRHGPRTALSMDAATLTYAEADARANRIANWALAQGLHPGDAVALVLPNRLDYVLFWMGLTKVGVVTALVNYNLQGAALRHCIGVSGWTRPSRSGPWTAPRVTPIWMRR
jgi:fatty-acyl-CoA synthase